MSKQVIKMLASLKLRYPMQSGDNLGYNDFFTNFIQRNLASLQKGVVSEDPELIQASMDVVTSVLYAGKFKWASDFLIGNFETSYLKMGEKGEYGRTLQMLTTQDEGTISNTQILIRHMMTGSYSLDELIDDFSLAIQNSVGTYVNRNYFHLNQLDLLYRMY